MFSQVNEELQQTNRILAPGNGYQHRTLAGKESTLPQGLVELAMEIRPEHGN
jgi:hypothetical protein